MFGKFGVNNNSSVTIRPHSFYKIARIMRDFNQTGRADSISAFVNGVENTSAPISNEYARLLKANSNLMQEIRFANKNKSTPFSSLEQQEQDLANFMPQLQGASFLRVALNIFQQFDGAYGTLIGLAERSLPDELFVQDYDRNPMGMVNVQERQFQLTEMEWNMSSVQSFAENVIKIRDGNLHLYEDLKLVADTMEKYYEFLHHRHAIDGIKIYRDAVITDIAITVFENMDAHGEIESGKEPNQVSAYTEGKALALASAVKEGAIANLISNIDNFQEFIQNTIGGLRFKMETLQKILEPIPNDIALAVNYRNYTRVTDNDWATLIQRIQDANPTSITDKSEEKLLSSTEKYALKFRDETIENIVKLLSDKNSSVRALVDYIMQRKAAMRQFYQSENSFYTCRISAGNPFLGQAPGALEVVPAEKPNAKIDDILGSNFDQVRDFVRGIKGAMAWHDLFLATSPRKKVDRAHLLMIGPAGCLANNTFIRYETRTKEGRRIQHKGGTIERLYQRFHNLTKENYPSPPQNNDCLFFLSSVNDEGYVFQNRIIDVVKTGEKECFEVVVAGGESIIATEDHPFFTGEKYVNLKDLNIGDDVLLHRNCQLKNGRKPRKYRRYIFVKSHPIAGTKVIAGKYIYKRLAESRAVIEASLNNLTLDQYIIRLNDGNIDGLEFLSREQHVHHIDENVLNNELSNLLVIDGREHNRLHSIENEGTNRIRYIAVEDVITSIKPVGKFETYDIKMAPPIHNYVANGFVVHNCGKTEIMRAVANEKNSVGIFAQGSDFLTCWKGEDQKNPKRLFQQALKIQKDTKKHVHIMIDEIDAVLNNDRNPTDTNLSLEFQILMDGMVSYPHISVWGATNMPDRIPQAMLRRFKVLIVGELSLEDRIRLLKHYVGYLPTDLTEADYTAAAKKLDGATGDVVAKVGEALWRDRMTGFVSAHKDEARRLTDWLNETEQFNIREFDDKKRFNLQQKLKKYICVNPDALNKVIDDSLKSVGIRSEIESARETYKRAKQFISQLESNTKSILAI